MRFVLLIILIVLADYGTHGPSRRGPALFLTGLVLVVW